MEENNLNKKNTKKVNHWTQENVNKAVKKINTEIFNRERQAPIQLKLDDLSILINNKITKRGIAKGLVKIQEDLNINILEIEKYTLSALFANSKKEQLDFLNNAKIILKIQVWTDIRFLMINKAITPGEITELIRRSIDIEDEMNKWMSSIEKVMSAER